MSLFRIGQLCAVLMCVAGCRSPGHPVPIASSSTLVSQPEICIQDRTTPTSEGSVRPVLFQETIEPGVEQPAAGVPFADDVELSLPRLMAEVQSRNPSLEAMDAAWRAAMQKYPQVVALDDPMFGVTTAPASFDSVDVESAYVLEASQKIPWFGKRAARGRVADAEASAAGAEANDARLRIAETTHLAFLDYYLVRKQLELNHRNLEILSQYRDTAQSKYRTNQVTQGDVLQADLELADLERRSLELDRMNTVSVARINTLLRVPPEAPLPPPPKQLNSPEAPSEIGVLQQIAIDQRPDLAALAARIRVEQAQLTLACKERRPDGEFFGRYDSFWQPADTQSDLRGQVGVRLNVPIYRSRLDAAVNEATWRVRQRRAEYEQRLLDIEYEVQTAYAQVEETRKSLTLYSERVLPLAEQNVKAARTNYDVGAGNFLSLATAQRQLSSIREKQQEALVAYHRRLAELDRIVGGSTPSDILVEK